MDKDKIPTEYNINKNPRKPKADIALLGLILGIIFPCIGILLLYWAVGWGNYPSFNRFLAVFTNLNNPHSMEQASKIISLSIIMNLIPFYYFLNKKANQTVKGIIIASALALLLVVFYKFVWQ